VANPRHFHRVLLGSQCCIGGMTGGGETLKGKKKEQKTPHHDNALRWKWGEREKNNPKMNKCPKGKMRGGELGSVFLFGVFLTNGGGWGKGQN